MTCRLADRSPFATLVVAWVCVATVLLLAWGVVGKLGLDRAARAVYKSTRLIACERPALTCTPLPALRLAVGIPQPRAWRRPEPTLCLTRLAPCARLRSCRSPPVA